MQLERELNQAKAAEFEAWLELVAGAHEFLPIYAAAFRNAEQAHALPVRHPL